MRLQFAKSFLVFSVFFVAGYYVSQTSFDGRQKQKSAYWSPEGHEGEVVDVYDQSSRSPSAVRTWAISTYLPEKPNEKVYLTIEGKQIKDISTTKPAVDYVLETDTIAFPGLNDMHNHIKYNVLPLWEGGQAQYKNRYEWRKFARYKDEVTGMMKGFDKTGVCAAFRWGELRALVGGTTSMQGGMDSCSSGFGPMNIEARNELMAVGARAATDPLGGPEYMANVYGPMLRPTILQSQSQLESLRGPDRLVATNRLYDTALLNLLKSKGIIDWLSTFTNEPRTLRTGIKLLIGQDYPTVTDNSLASYQKVLPEITAHLTSRGLKPKDIEKQLANQQLWLFGDGASKKGYLTIGPPANPPVRDLALLSNAQTMDFYGKGGVISPDPKIRRYLAMFETAARRSYLATFASPNPYVVAHIAEGARNDRYNQLEYQFASELGLVQRGLVIIHGVGLTEAMMRDAVQKNVALVWSPTSNLLLYGETLDVVKAKQLGLVVALGSDWGPSGTKSMLDEIKIARQYLDKMRVPKTTISDKDIVDMATINAARALGIENSVGKVAKNYLANIVFVNKRSALARDPDVYSALIKSEAPDVELVVVGGEPLYGDQKHLEDVSTGFRDATPPEPITKCNMQKAMRFPFTSKADTDMQAKGINLKSLSRIEELLTSQFAAFKVKLQTQTPRLAPKVPVRPDPLFPCEDTAYQNYMNNYVKTTLDQYNSQKAALRTQYRLNPNFDPMATTGSETEEEETDQ